MPTITGQRPQLGIPINGQFGIPRSTRVHHWVVHLATSSRSFPTEQEPFTGPVQCFALRAGDAPSRPGGL